MGNLARKLLFITSLSLLIFPVLTFAQNRAAIDVSIPCISCKFADNPSPVGVIANFYELAIAMSGVLALGMIIYAGILRVTNASNPGKVGESNEIIYNALLGIVLLFGSYILLNTINPQLTKLEIPALTKIEIPASTGTASGGAYQCSGETEAQVISCHVTMEECTAKCSDAAKCKKVVSCLVTGAGDCPVTPIPPITDPAALALEAAAPNPVPIWNSGDPASQRNLDRLRVEFDKLKSELGKIGASARETSVYRPLSYQQHFYDIKLRYDALVALEASNPATFAKCDAIYKAVKFEAESKHGICKFSDKKCVVSPATPNAVHTRGTGIDIKLSGIAYSAINSFMQSKGIKLSWQGLPTDKVHFNLR